MISNAARSLGGQVRGKQQRENALRKYYENPSFCLYCQQMLLVGINQKVAALRQNKFCNKACAAKYNNSIKEYTTNPNKKKLVKIRIYKCCGLEYSNPRVLARCKACRKTKINKTNLIKKKDSTHSKIRSHARTIFGKPPECEHCRYALHVEVCHIIPISSFSPEVTLGEMNARENLIALCPNCHWEFDHGLLEVPRRGGM